MSNHDALQDPGGAATSFWTQNGPAIETLAAYAGGILVYALIVNFFYQIISKRVMFGGEDRGGRRHVGGPLHGFLYLFLFPLMSFAFFMLLSLALLFLGGEAQTPVLTITLAMSVVLAVRLSAYFSEATSHDVAKMLPLGLLGVMLVRAEVLEFAESLARLQAVLDNIGLIGLYFGIVVLTEYLLRTIYLAVQMVRNDGSPPKVGRPPRPAGAHGSESRGPGMDKE